MFSVRYIIGKKNLLFMIKKKFFFLAFHIKAPASSFLNMKTEDLKTNIQL